MPLCCINYIDICLNVMDEYGYCGTNFSYKHKETQSRYWDTLKLLSYWESKLMEGHKSTLQLARVQLPTAASIIYEETESISLHFTNSNVEKNHPGTVEELPDLSRKGPPLMWDDIDCRSTDLIDSRFYINILWSILGSLPDVAGNKNPPVGPYHGHTS